MYFIHGGVWTDTKFEQVYEDKVEIYGPFNTYEQALDVWRAETWKNVDDAHHRLFIQKIVDTAD